MDDTIAGAVLRWYESLEAPIADFLKAVPLHGQNLNTWSPTFTMAGDSAAAK